MTVSIVLAILGAILGAVERRHATTKAKVAKSVNEANSAIIDSIEYIIEEASQMIGCWDTHTRATVYACVRRGSEFVLCPMGRRSYNPELAKAGRRFCRTGEGMLGAVWRGGDNGMAVANFPVDMRERRQWYMDSYGMSETVVDGLTMYPTSMFGVRLQYNREPVGVVLFECDDTNRPGRFDLEFLDVFENNERVRELLKILQSELYAIRGIVPELIHHETYHTVPTVDPKLLPERDGLSRDKD